MAVREIRTGEHAEVSKSDQGANVKEENAAVSRKRIAQICHRVV